MRLSAAETGGRTAASGQGRSPLCTVAMILCTAAIWAMLHGDARGEHFHPHPDRDYSVREVIRRLAPVIRPEMRRAFRGKGCPYPPWEVTLIALKERQVMELWGLNRDFEWKLIKTYPILGASGLPGPKLREGDLQVPEGAYRVTAFNPNSRFHLSLKLNYPNSRDRKRACQDGRDDLGGNIFIHGGSDSLGCLAMGDSTIEELFVLGYDAGLRDLKVIITPYDFRSTKVSEVQIVGVPGWVRSLYERLRRELLPYQRPVRMADKGAPPGRSNATESSLSGGQLFVP